MGNTQGNDHDVARLHNSASHSLFAPICASSPCKATLLLKKTRFCSAVLPQSSIAAAANRLSCNHDGAAILRLAKAGGADDVMRSVDALERAEVSWCVGLCTPGGKKGQTPGGNVMKCLQHHSCRREA